MSIIEQLSDPKVWEEFYAYKKEKAHLSQKDDEFFVSYIKNKEYVPLALRIQKEGFCFDYPTKKLVNKIETGKKRTVYTFGKDESMVLKLIAHLLIKYDASFCGNLYSFRKNSSVAKAVKHFTNQEDIDKMYCYKLDVSNYFNSIDVNFLLEQLKELLADDELLYRFFCELLSKDRAYFDNELIIEKRGAMAGIPVSPFFANLYLSKMDEYFEANNILYARYSDDIIVFAKDPSELNKYKNIIHNFIEDYKLRINPKKETYSKPSETWEFLGIAYTNGKIDLSRSTMEKMKGKIRRKARALYRWKIRKGANTQQVQKVMIRIFNNKFFYCDDSHDLNWSRWFFPLINTTDGLKQIDKYLQQYIRYLGTGKFCKKNYETDYSMMKKLGYKSLVHEYYSENKQ